MWQEWIRLSLVDRVTHSVLSQDLAAVTGENESFADNSMALLASMQVSCFVFCFLFLKR